MKHTYLVVGTGVKEDKVHIVPIAINTTLFDSQKTTPLDLPIGDLVFGVQPRGRRQVQRHVVSSGSQSRRTFRFLSTFKWEMRKGWDRLLEAYLKVCLSQSTQALNLVGDSTVPFISGVHT